MQVEVHLLDLYRQAQGDCRSMPAMTVRDAAMRPRGHGGDAEGCRRVKPDGQELRNGVATLGHVRGRGPTIGWEG